MGEYFRLVEALGRGARLPFGAIQEVLGRAGRTADELLRDAFASDSATPWPGKPCGRCARSPADLPIGAFGRQHPAVLPVRPVPSPAEVLQTLPALRGRAQAGPRGKTAGQENPSILNGLALKENRPERRMKSDNSLRRLPC